MKGLKNGINIRTLREEWFEWEDRPTSHGHWRRNSQPDHGVVINWKEEKWGGENTKLIHPWHELKFMFIVGMDCYRGHVLEYFESSLKLSLRVQCSRWAENS